MQRDTAVKGRDVPLPASEQIEIELDPALRDARPAETAAVQATAFGAKESDGPLASRDPPVRRTAEVDPPPTTSNNAVLFYTGLALLLLVPGLAFKGGIDFDAVQSLTLDIRFGSGWRFWLGVVGTTLTALLLLYPLRKQFARYLPFGSVSSWLHLHVVFGILGPALILYHANFGFALRDFNANVALLTMLIVVASGFVGQLVYTRASLDFYSAKRELHDCIGALASDIKSLQASPSDTAVVLQHLENFERELPTSRLGVIQSIRSAFQNKVRHYQLFRETSALIADAQRRYSWPSQEYERMRRLIGGNLSAAFAIARRASGSSLFEQLWSRWRHFHLPLFLVMLIATAIHVWSVWDSNAFSRSRAVVPAPEAVANKPTELYTPDGAINALKRWDETTKALVSGQKFFANASYAGSASCQGCHQEQFKEWANTWHAKMYRTVNDPSAKGEDNIVVGAFDGRAITFNKVRVPTEDRKETGEVSFEVVPTTFHPATREPGYFFTVRDPSTPADSQTFKVAIVIGGNLEQMYHVKVGDHHFPAPLRWRVAPNGMSAWQNDNTPQPGNWVFYRGAGTTNGKPRTPAQLPFDRYAEGQCMGCHTTGYRYERNATPINALWSMVGNSIGNGVSPNGVLTGPKQGPPGTAAELGIGCESCHGPGSAHNAAQSDTGGSIPAKPKPLVAGKIVHPLIHMPPLQQSMMCGQCHSRGLNDISPGTVDSLPRPAGVMARAANPLGFPDVLPTPPDKPADKGFLPGDTDLSARVRMFSGYAQSEQTKQAFWPNDWAKQGRMQWQDHTKSAHAVSNTASCLTCHSGHAPLKKRFDGDRFQLRQSKAVHDGIKTSKTENQCESCHQATGSAMQPNKEMFDGSVMHQAGVTCINCHMAPVATRAGRTTKTPSKGDGTFDTVTGKNWDVSSHTYRVAPTSESAALASGINMRSACVSCHGPEPRQPMGSQQSDQKLDELFACRKEFVRGRLERLQLGLSTVESRKGIVLGKARAEMQFVTSDRSWGAHNWDKTLRALQAAAEEIGSSCGGEATCQVSKLVTLNTQECSLRTAIVLPPTNTALAAPRPSAPGQVPAPTQSPTPAQSTAPTQPSAPAAGQPPPPASSPQVATATPVPPAATPTQPAAPSVGQPPAPTPAPQVSTASPAPPATVAPNGGPTTTPTQPADPATSAGSPPPPAAALAALTVFKDCETCPDMIAVPNGEFWMGSSVTEKGRSSAEGPVRKVTFSKPFAAGRYPVSRDQFDAFVADKKYQVSNGCRVAEGDRWTVRPEFSYRSTGFPQDGQHPVVCISFADAKAYADWLAAKTGKTYRLLSEAEREYATRAATTTAYWWHDTFYPRMAAHDTRLRMASGAAAVPGLSSFQGTVPIQSFRANPWGFFQVHGNVADWTADCWNKTLTGLPTNGTAATTGDCTQRVLRGGAWNYWPEDLRSAYREAVNAEHRYVNVGFRVARELEAGR